MGSLTFPVSLWFNDDLTICVSIAPVTVMSWTLRLVGGTTCLGYFMLWKVL